MLVARAQEGRIQAASALKAQGPFHCPRCDEVVILRKGTIRIAHFAHQPASTCTWTTGESAIHLQSKQAIVDALRASGYKAEPEVSLGSQRADVYAMRDGQRFVVELQHTPIDPREIERRTRGYLERGLAVTWVSLVSIDYRCFLRPSDEPIPMRYTPRPFERWMERFNYGFVQLFNPALDGVLCGKLRAAKTNVPVSEWTTRDGARHSAGGYQKTAQQYADLFCDAYLPLARLELEVQPRSMELKVSGMTFPRGNFARLVARADTQATPCPL